MYTLIPTGKSDIFEDMKMHRRSRAVLPILILRAREGRIIAFKELGDTINFSVYPRLGDILDCINNTIYEIDSCIPTLSAIVVRENNGENTPSNWMANKMREQLNIDPTWDNYYRKLIQRVFDYPHWDKILDQIIQHPKW